MSWQPLEEPGPRPLQPWHFITWSWNCDLVIRCGQGVAKDWQREKPERGRRRQRGGTGESLQVCGWCKPRLW